jgi:enoyl-[acyl-carrier-protein] reductase (NADH)
VPESQVGPDQASSAKRNGRVDIHEAVVNRPQTPEDIGYAAAFLSSDLGVNITGQAINVDGGFEMH